MARLVTIFREDKKEKEFNSYSYIAEVSKFLGLLTGTDMKPELGAI